MAVQNEQWRCKTDKDTDMASELKKKLKENDTKNLGRKQSKTFFLGNQKIIKKITLDDND